MIFRVVFALVVAALPASAHHSFAAEFDSGRPITAAGVVNRVEWTNPHAYLYIEVKDEQGQPVGWRFEMGSPNSLLRCGWTRSSVKPGDAVTVEGYRAKDGSRNAYTLRVESGGHTIYSRPGE